MGIKMYKVYTVILMGMRVCPKPFGPGYYTNSFSGQNVSKDGGLAPTFKKGNLGI